MSSYLREYSPTNYLSPVRRVSPQHMNQSLNMSQDQFYNIEDGQVRYQELINENLWLKDQIQRKRQGHPFDCHQTYFQNIERGLPIGGDRTKNDMIMWGMIERNKFLEEKLSRLRKQQQKQYHTIRRIEQSDEWLTRHVCIPSKCYHQRYMQLLRVRSPFF